jgi:pimeloyl-ACP methyl ester carboxylesterase
MDPTRKRGRMMRTGRTRPFRRNGKVIPGSIADVRYIRLGGFDQWVMIRGTSLRNPPLIMLSGGPGLSENALFRYYNARLENAFTVVYWDQRGSGKSYHRDLPASSMTVEQFITDLSELVDWVRVRTDHGKVAIFGHSWGSVLGVLYAARFPEKVSAYAGSGQIGDWPAAEAASYAIALKEANEQGNRKALRELRSIGPPPYSAKAVWTERTWLQRLEGNLRPRALWGFGRVFLSGKEYSVLDIPGLFRGFRCTFDAMWDEVSRLNLLELAPVLNVPVFVLHGRHDHWVPPETALAYFEALEAPSKKLVWFEKSGHEPFVDEPAEFNQSLVELVRPVIT